MLVALQRVALEAIIREAAPPLVTTEAGGWAARLGRPAASLLSALGLPTRGLRRDLALLGRPPERQLAEQATAAITVPALAARQEAAARRRDARHALAAFLDLVVISIVAGAGSRPPSPTPGRPAAAGRSPRSGPRWTPPG